MSTATPRRQPSLLALVPVGVCLAFLAACQRGPSPTSEYPGRSIDLIVPWAAGGGTDRLARFVADALQRRLGQPVIVINRTGGSGAVGHSAGALAAPDGHTLTMATFELSTMQAMGISQLTWRDFEPVAQLNGDAAAILVRHDSAWTNLTALLDAIRRQPGTLKMSGTATGGAWDLARAGLLLAAGLPPRQVIWAPTQGSAPALVELLGGHVDVVCCSVPEAASQIEGGQARVLAVLAPERLEDYPQFPTAREQGVAYDAVGWRGLALPKGTPAGIVRQVNDALTAIAASAEFRDFMRKNGFAIRVRGPEEFAGFLQTEETRWRAVIEGAGYQSLGQTHDPGPNAMPRLLLALLVAALIAEFLRTRRDRGGARDTGVTRLSRTALFVLAALVVYVAAMPWIGFVAGTLAFAGIVMVRLGARWWLAGLSSVALVAAIHLLFVVLFKVQLP